MISFDEFLKLSEKGNLIPLFDEMLADVETPVSAYYKLADQAKNSFLLESVAGEEKVARFSFVAKDPELILSTKKNVATITRFVGKKTNIQKSQIVDSPLTFIRDIMGQFKFVHVDGLPRFCGGMVGYLAYDVVRFFEKIPAKNPDDLRIPDSLLMLAKDILIFDHLNHTIKCVHCAYISEKATLADKKKVYLLAVKRIALMRKALTQPLRLPEKKRGRNALRRVQLRPVSNFTEAQFTDVVEKAKEEIRRGEIIQVVLSQRFKVKITSDPFLLYRSLRVLNPSPYMFYLNYGDLQLIGSSPELLVRCEDGLVETRPIAGTRPRGLDDADDARLAKELLADPKEKAEHIMLVDLGRNDLGRVCRQGTVKVSEFMTIEKYSHVMHIVSNVQGQLRADKDSLDVLQAAFPAGTLSGAPKIRAMEIIDCLENVSRGAYGGCIGYFSFSGNLDTCITIRTIVAKGNHAYVQAGAGIVADSNPKTEYQETLNKAKAQLMAIEMAHQQFN